MKKIWIKKSLCIALVCAMGCSLMACGNEKKTTSKKKTTTESTEETTEEDNTGVNLIANGDFSSTDMGTWEMFLSGGAGSIAIENEELVANVDSVGDLDYSVQAHTSGFELTKGCTYMFVFDVKSDIAREFEWRLQMNGGDYHAYVGDAAAKADTEYTTIECEFTMEEATDVAPTLCFNMGNHVGAEPGVAAHKMYFDNISLYMLDDTGKEEEDTQVYEKNVLVNQVGYTTDAEKIATFRGDKVDDSFQVMNVNTNEMVYKGSIDDEFKNKQADETDYYGVFTEVTEPGTYKIITESMGESYEFTIGDDVYADLYGDVINMFKMQECGTELSEKEAGDFAHKACHTGKATIYGTDKTIDVSGGWHDAGDYGRYVVPGAKSVADLLLAVDNNAPENKKDILKEVKYELDWMFKMQDSATGGVYHKVTCAGFPGEVPPEEETEDLIVAPLSNAASGDFAAVMAMASQSYKKSDVAYANKCLEVAKKAFAYMEEHRNEGGYTNPAEITTGEYGDTNISDEYFWAAAQLYKATNDVAYLEAANSVYKEEMIVGLGWADVGAYGLYAIATSENGSKDSIAFYNSAKAKLIETADKYVSLGKTDGYGVSLDNMYSWGSNMTVANNADLMLLVNTIEPKKAYVKSAREHLNYLLGNNATSYCFVTGYGTLSPVSTHHRLSMAAGKTMKGMLVGGVNQNLEDTYAQQVLSEAPIAKCYVDNSQSYSCNEVTIYWNSPLAYLISGLNVKEQ